MNGIPVTPPIRWADLPQGESPITFTGLAPCNPKGVTVEVGFVAAQCLGSNPAPELLATVTRKP